MRHQTQSSLVYSSIVLCLVLLMGLLVSRALAYDVTESDRQAVEQAYQQREQIRQSEAEQTAQRLNRQQMNRWQADTNPRQHQVPSWVAPPVEPYTVYGPHGQIQQCVRSANTSCCY